MRVTLVTGFLGSGKTTVVRRWLAEYGATERFGVVVNDLSELEVDADLLRDGHHVSESDGTLSSVFAGSIDRERRDLFRDTLMDYAARRVPHVLVETSGATHPGPVIDAVTTSPGARLGAVVAVVDARAVHHDHDGGRRLATLAASGATHAEVLLHAQIQAATHVVVTKVDLVPESARQAIADGLHAVNPTAGIVLCHYGRFDASPIFRVGPYQRTPLPAPPSPGPRAIESHVVRDPRPFHPGRLFRLYREQLGLGVHRSKGFIWLASRPDQVLLWNQAGGAIGLEVLGFWKAAVANDAALLREERELLAQRLTSSHPIFGDRLNEVTVIGEPPDCGRFAQALATCFCTDDEVRHWCDGGAFDDPWPRSIRRLA